MAAGFVPSVGTAPGGTIVPTFTGPELPLLLRATTTMSVPRTLDEAAVPLSDTVRRSSVQAMAVPETAAGVKLSAKSPQLVPNRCPESRI